jgi:DNA repair exonuclease SbcCD ATPase subunit
MKNVLKSKKDPSLTNAKQRQDAVGRISNLERAYTKMVESIDASFKEVATDLQDSNKSIDGMDRLLRALMEVLGKDVETKIIERVKENRIAELEAQSAKAAESVKVFLAEGKLLAATVVKNDTDILVVTQKDQDGNLRYPVRNHLALVQFTAGVKELLTDKNVGEVVTLPEGGTVEILECYNVVAQDEKQEAPTAETLPDTTFAVNPEGK